MLADIDHPFGRGEEVYDVTFENVQAGLRTDYLFRLANQHGGIVLGTGDLSELALGWCTYGVGDQMSHYNVNAGVPKTLIQHLIRWVIGLEDFSGDVDEILPSILTPRSRRSWFRSRRARCRRARRPPSGPTSCRISTCSTRCASASGRRRSPSWRCTPGRTSRRAPGRRLSRPSGATAYDLPEIRRWLEVFLRRFFGFSQFKRSAMPNGPKVSAGGSLSPRGDWRAPSDGKRRGVARGSRAERAEMTAKRAVQNDFAPRGSSSRRREITFNLESTRSGVPRVRTS